MDKPSHRTDPSFVRHKAAVCILGCLFATACIGEGDRSLLVKWRDGPDSDAAVAGNARVGSVVRRNCKLLGWQLVTLPQGMSVQDGLGAYRALGTVLAVQPDGRMELHRPPAPTETEHPEPPVSISETRDPRRPHGPPEASAGVIPNDPMFRQQWNLARIGATNAWARTTGSPEVVVAVIAAGVHYLHQDLRDNMWRNPGESGIAPDGRDRATNGVDDDLNGYVDDVNGIDTGSHDSDPMDEGGSPFHGTRCASIIGAGGNDARGVAGINWRTSIMAIRVFPDVQHPSAWLSSLLEGYEYLLMMKGRGVNVRIANMSYGYGSLAVESLRAAHEALGNAGILQVSGAGNSGANLEAWAQYPWGWRLPSMIIVGGSDASDNLWSSSNHGWNIVDLAAPAAGILFASGPGTNAYETGSGNSFSGPHVVGAAALLLAAQPDLTIDRMKASLFGSVDQRPAFRGKVATHGRLNLAWALAYLADTDPPAIVVTATPRGHRTPTNAPINVVFNRSINRASVEEALVISPALNGTFDWAADSRSFTFHPTSPFDSSTNYTVRILHSAADETGGTLDGNYDQVREPTGADDFTWAFYFPMPNDEFAGAQLLTGAHGSLQGNNRRASVADLAEVTVFPPEWIDFGSTLWYQWTPPDPGGWFTFDLTVGTAFDTLLLIYTGDRLDRLMTVASNDNHGTLRGSRASFAASPGTNYSVVVAGRYDGDPAQVGSFQLRWYPTPSPEYTGTEFSPRSAMPGARLTLTGTNFSGATAVLFNGASANFTNALSHNLDLRITATVPPDARSGPITIVTPHGDVTSTATFQVLPPPLMVRRMPEGLIEVSWPATSDELGLEFAAQLPAPVWESVSASPQRSEGQSRVLVDGTATTRFFRLRGAP